MGVQDGCVRNRRAAAEAMQHGAPPSQAWCAGVVVQQRQQRSVRLSELGVSPVTGALWHDRQANRKQF